MKLQPALTDDERFPLLKNRKLLHDLRQDALAPRFNFASGDRLDAASLEKVRDYAANLENARFWQENSTPPWLEQYYQWCRSHVPFFREWPEDFSQAPTMRRSQIAAEQWKLVANDCNLEDLLVYSTSGTTGIPMQVLFDPVSQASWIPQLESILREDAVLLDKGASTVAICLVCCQNETLTYASLSTYLDGAGILKINLNEKDWNDSDDRIRYLEKYNPQIITGDPFTFSYLARLGPDIKPRAMVSSAMALQEGLRQKLQQQFGCPVYDIYSLTECRMISVSREFGIHRLIRPELYVEIMRPENDEPLPAGEVGEIVISGGTNPFLPLIRYRTGDFAALRFAPKGPELVDFSGRAPTIFADDRGNFVNNVDIARAMCQFSLAGYRLKQRKDRQIEFIGWGADEEQLKVREMLAEMFGESLVDSVVINKPDLNEGKKVVFESEIEQKDMQL